MDNFANGVYGINLTKLMQGPGTADLALLTELTQTFEEVNEQDGGDPGVCVGADVFKLFYTRLVAVFQRRKISIPTLVESQGDDGLIFRIHQVDSHAEINESEDFDPGDLLLGVGILGFPNDIAFPKSFTLKAAWHLWTIS